MDDKVTLDRGTFKALASESRIAILKSLDERRKTASELSQGLGATVQAVAEHLNSLRSAGLVERRESGRKWVYYELTEKGRAVLHPDTKKFWVLVALSLIAFTAAFYRPVLQEGLGLATGQQQLMAPGDAPRVEAGQQPLAAAGARSEADAQQAKTITATAPPLQSPDYSGSRGMKETEVALLLAGAALLAAAGWLKHVRKTA